MKQSCRHFFKNDCLVFLEQAILKITVFKTFSIQFFSRLNITTPKSEDAATSHKMRRQIFIKI